MESKQKSKTPPPLKAPYELPQYSYITSFGSTTQGYDATIPIFTAAFRTNAISSP